MAARLHFARATELLLGNDDLGEHVEPHRIERLDSRATVGQVRDQRSLHDVAPIEPHDGVGIARLDALDVGCQGRGSADRVTARPGRCHRQELPVDVVGGQESDAHHVLVVARGGKIRGHARAGIAHMLAISGYHVGVIAALTGREPQDVGTTTFRPPYHPVTIGALADPRCTGQLATRRPLGLATAISGELVVRASLGGRLWRLRISEAGVELRLKRRHSFLPRIPIGKRLPTWRP